jgi:hypothetical protein
MNSDELIVNIQCVEHGIVPLAGVDLDHIGISLLSLSDVDRRKSTRKFRKLLKKAIHFFASQYYKPGSGRYSKFVHDQKKMAGLNSERGIRPFSRGESSFRKLIVARYLSHIEAE